MPGRQHILKALFHRELTGSQARSTLSIRLKVDTVIPTHALQAGHIVLGFTPTTSHIITYTVQPTLASMDEQLFFYTVHFWRFKPHSLSTLQASTPIFHRNGVSDPNLLIHVFFNTFNVVLDGRSSNPEDNPRCYLTITQIPSKGCPPLTLTLTHDQTPPYPYPSPTTSHTPPHNFYINTGSTLHTLTLHKSIKTGSTLKLELTDITKTRPSSNFTNHYATKLLNKPEPKPKFFKRSTELVQQKQQQQITNSVYDSIEKLEIEKPISFSLFRKKRRADKVYEFEEDENRPVQSAKSSNILYIKKCIQSINRSFRVHADDEESISTTTELDDDYSEFPASLPLDLFTPTTRLSMVRNGTHKDAVKVLQASLDLEQLSNEIAAYVCKIQNFNFSFLIDFDFTILETHGEELTCYSVILVQAALNQAPRQNYTLEYLLSYTPSKPTAKLTFKPKLKLVTKDSVREEPWNPTRHNVKPFFQGDNHSLNNILMANEWTSVTELADPQGILTIFSNPANEHNSDIDSS